jgi:hypothetical protein
VRSSVTTLGRHFLSWLVMLGARIVFYPWPNRAAERSGENAMSKEQVGYLIWGVFAALVLIPELLAVFGRSFTPFPGIARTATNLEARWPWAAMIVLAGLAVLAVHLIFYPWPDLPRH